MRQICDLLCVCNILSLTVKVCNTESQSYLLKQELSCAIQAFACYPIVDYSLQLFYEVQ